MHEGGSARKRSDIVGPPMRENSKAVGTAKSAMDAGSTVIAWTTRIARLILDTSVMHWTGGGTAKLELRGWKKPLLDRRPLQNPAKLIDSIGSVLCFLLVP